MHPTFISRCLPISGPAALGGRRRQAFGEQVVQSQGRLSQLVFDHPLQGHLQVGQHELQGLGPAGVLVQGQLDGVAVHLVALDRKRELEGGQLARRHVGRLGGESEVESGG